MRAAEAIVLTTLGAVLGVALDRVLDPSIRLEAAVAIVVLACALLLVLANRSILADSRATAHEVTEALAEIDRKSHNERQANRAEIIDLVKGVRTRASIQSIGDLNKSPDLEADIVAQALLAAKKEIVILDTLDRMGDSVQTFSGIDPTILQDFFTELDAHLEANPSIRYSRIIQVQDLSKPLQGIETSGKIRHFQRVISGHDAHDHRAEIFAAPQLCNLTFMVVDDRDVLLEIHRFDPSRATGLNYCQLVVNDAPEMAAKFKTLWNDISHHRDTRPLEISDFEGLWVEAQGSTDVD